MSALQLYAIWVALVAVVGIPTTMYLNRIHREAEKNS